MSGKILMRTQNGSRILR